MGTGHHAARAAKVGPGKTAAVVGDGAVGLCGVIAARRLGAERIILLGRHPDRIALAREFGATDVVSERGEEAVGRVREPTGGSGVHSVLEYVGLAQSMSTAISIARPGGAVGRVGVPQDETMPASQPAFYNNVIVGGGPAPCRAYIEELLPDVLKGKIDPGRVFDRVLGLDEVPDGDGAMNDRRGDQSPDHVLKRRLGRSRSHKETADAEAQTRKQRPGGLGHRAWLHGHEPQLLWPTRREAGNDRPYPGGCGPRRDLFRHRRGLRPVRQRRARRRSPRAIPWARGDRHQVRLRSRSTDGGSVAEV